MWSNIQCGSLNSRQRVEVQSTGSEKLRTEREVGSWKANSSSQGGYININININIDIDVMMASTLLKFQVSLSNSQQGEAKCIEIKPPFDFHQKLTRERNKHT